MELVLEGTDERSTSDKDAKAVTVLMMSMCMRGRRRKTEQATKNKNNTDVESAVSVISTTSMNAARPWACEHKSIRLSHHETQNLEGRTRCSLSSKKASIAHPLDREVISIVPVRPSTRASRRRAQ